jgi:hypothetical protein
MVARGPGATERTDGFGQIGSLETLKPLIAQNGADKVKNPVDLLG